MAEDHSVDDDKSVEKSSIADENGIAKSRASPSSLNCENFKPDPNYLCSPRSNKKIFVGALSPETTEQNLVDYFSKFGEIVSCAVKVARDTGYSRGFGFIVFKNDEDVKKVFSVSEHVLNGKKIDPKPAKCPKDTQRKVFVGGLDPQVTPEEIEKHFSKFGKVEAVEAPLDSTKMRRRSYAFVVFSSEYEAKRAASTERQEISGNCCDVRVAVPREVSLRQRAAVQVTPQLSFVDLQRAMLNFLYYSSLSQQPAIQDHFAWQQQHNTTVRPHFRTTFDQQAAEKLFSQSGMTRADVPWYDASGARSQNSIAPTSARNHVPLNPTHPYMTFPFSFQSAASPQFFYQATPGYYYQPPPPSASNSETQLPTGALSGTVNHGSNQSSNMNDFMAAIVTANQVPLIAAPAPSNYPAGSAGDMTYPFRQQQQPINPAFYPTATNEGMFNDPSSNVSGPLFYGASLPASSSSNAIKSRLPKPHFNGVHHRPFQNGHLGKDSDLANAVADRTPPINNGSVSTVRPLETQMSSLSVAEM